MTAAENAPETPWEPQPAYDKLAALACAERPEWDAQDLWDAITAVRNAGWSYKRVRKEVLRLAATEDETPATLRNSARRLAGAVPASPDPDLYAALRSGDYATAWAATHDEPVPERIRATGGQPALTEDNDPRRTP
jgi:hypothetical protein